MIATSEVLFLVFLGMVLLSPKQLLALIKGLKSVYNYVSSWILKAEKQTTACLELEQINSHSKQKKKK